jgi:branched-chain amino acid transport system ATP-binding protein
MLEVTDLVVRYGRVAALQGVTLRADAGEVVAVVGPNGAGKSTLLNTIAGRFRSASGEIAFDDASIARLAPERIVRRGVALVPEGRHIFATLTVEENLRLGAMAAAGRSGADDVADWLGRFPILGQYRDVPAGRLSGGEQQQLAIARAMVSKPRMLLLDEPSLGLAPLVVDEVFRVLQELHDRGTPILLVEQNANRAVEFADRTYVLKSGRVVLEGPREEMRDARARMTSAYLGAEA